MIRLLVALGCLLPVAHAEDTGMAPVLIIAFGPFDGRGVNGSATLAGALDGMVIAGHRVVSAVLPVTWGTPEARIPELLATHEPVVVLGLGEGHPGRIAFERVAHNRRAHADVGGAPPPGPVIEDGGPEQRRSRLDFDPESFADAAVPVVASDDAGSYLCNNLLWALAASDHPRVGFCHLPPQGAVNDAAYVGPLLPALRRLLADNLN